MPCHACMHAFIESSCEHKSSHYSYCDTAHTKSNISLAPFYVQPVQLNWWAQSWALQALHTLMSIGLTRLVEQRGSVLPNKQCEERFWTLSVRCLLPWATC